MLTVYVADDPANPEVDSSTADGPASPEARIPNIQDIQQYLEESYGARYRYPISRKVAWFLQQLGEPGSPACLWVAETSGLTAFDLWNDQLIMLNYLSNRVNDTPCMQANGMPPHMPNGVQLTRDEIRHLGTEACEVEYGRRLERQRRAAELPNPMHTVQHAVSASSTSAPSGAYGNDEQSASVQTAPLS